MIHLRLLGPLELEGPDEDSTSSVLSQSKRLGVLAYLAAAEPRGFHRRDELIGVFWPDRDDAAARQSLRQALYFLRHALGGDVILSRGDDDVAVDRNHVWCDVVEFEQAVAEGDSELALRLYRGEFMSAFHLSGVPELERWMDLERDRLRTLAIAAGEQSAHAMVEAGDMQGAIAAGRRVTELAPASGRAARTLIELLLKSGDRAGAVDAYDAFSKRLARDYSLDPPADVEALIRRVRSGDAGSSVAPRSLSWTGELRARDDRNATPLGEARSYRGRITLLAVLAGAIALWWLSPLRPHAADNGIVITRLIQLTFDEAPELTPAISPDGGQVAYTSTTPSSTAGRNSYPSGAPVVVRSVSGGRSIQVTGDSLVRERFPRWSPDGSQLIFAVDGRIHRAPELGGTPRPVLADSGVSYPAWSPDGTRLAYGLSDPYADTLFVVDFETGQRRKIGPGYWPVWSPDGRWIAYVVDNSFYSRLGGGLANVAPSAIDVVGADGGAPVTVVPNASLNVSPAWLPDGRLLFVSSRGGGRDVYVVDLNDDGTPRGDPERLTTGLNPHTISASADGRAVVYSTLELRRNIWSMEIPDGDPVSGYDGEQVTLGRQVVEGVAVSPDGQWLAFDSDRSGNQDVYLQALSGGEVIQLTTGPTDEFVNGWSPDGQWLTGHGFRNGHRDIYIVRSDGTGYEIVYDAASEDRYPDWSPDGRSIAFSSTAGGPRSIYITTRSEGSTWSEPRLLTQGDHPRWSKDGSLVTFTDQEAVGVVDVASGERREIFVARTVGVASSWSNGDELIVLDRGSDGTVLFYALALDGSPPRPVFRFDDPLRLPRGEFVISQGRMYYSFGQYSGDLWVMDLAW